MKKLIRRYYFFIAILLVLAYQYLSGLVLSSDFALRLSDFGYYLSDMMLHFLVVFIAFLLWLSQENGKELTVRSFAGLICFIVS